MKLLIIEDNSRMGELLRDFMLQQGFDVLLREHGRAIDSDIHTFQPDVIVLDLKLPGISGMDLCRNIRPTFPGKIIILTSSTDDFDHVACLEVGADDYMSKPVNPRVVLARTRMLMRRPQSSVTGAAANDSLEFGNLSLRQDAQRAYLKGQAVSLSNSEFKLLWLLASSADEVMTREALFKALRGIEFDGLDRSIDTKVVALRKKLGDAGNRPQRIVTIRNKGYMFVPEAWA